MPLTLRFTPGRVVATGDAITPDLLNALANPTVELLGTVSTTTIADNSITLPKLIVGILTADASGQSRMADGFVSAAKLAAALDLSTKTITGNPSVTWSGTISFATATFTPPPGFTVQQVAAQSVILSTLTTAGAGTGDLSAATSGAIPIDDTIPQNGEGAQLITLAITPKSATNQLEIEVFIPVANGVAGTQVAALFQDTTANALAVTTVTLNASYQQALILRYRMVAGTTIATTFKVRVGCNAGTLNINGAGGVRQFGGINAVRVFIKEITA